MQYSEINVRNRKEREMAKVLLMALVGDSEAWGSKNE